MLLTERRTRIYIFDCLSKIHLDLDTNYPYLISFYVSWLCLVSGSGRHQAGSGLSLPCPPWLLRGQINTIISQAGCYGGRDWELASLHQRLSTYNQLRASAPPLHPDCGANVQAIVSHTWISINLQIISSHDTWSPHRMWEKAGWAQEALARRTMHCDLPEQNSIPMTTSASAGRGRHSSQSVTALSQSTKIIICTVIILQHILYLCW